MVLYDQLSSAFWGRWSRFLIARLRLFPSLSKHHHFDLTQAGLRDIRIRYVLEMLGHAV